MKNLSECNVYEYKNLAVGGMSREWKWQRLGRPCEIYEDARRVDGPVLPEFPIPICDCGRPAGVMQSRDEDTAARAYYCCVDYHVSVITMHLLLCYVYLLMLKLGLQDLERCYFFQWIDGPEKTDYRYLMFSHLEGALPHDRFRRWVPPPPDPVMTGEEKSLATAQHLQYPPLCECGDPAECSIDEAAEPGEGVVVKYFLCRNKNRVRQHATFVYCFA